MIDVLSKQLEKTRNDLQSDLLDMEWRLDHEGKEFHHFDDFCQLYRAEILNLNRTLVNIFCYTFFVTAFLGQDNFSHSFVEDNGRLHDIVKIFDRPISLRGPKTNYPGP